jgi:epoxide hydrolase 4
MRGYNLSSRPDGVSAYDTDQLTADISGLIHERGAQSALLVGHDWGGSVAWATAMNHPEVVDRLAILNAAHPRKLSQGLHHPGQLRKSWYFFFDLPELPENIVHANHWHFFRHFLRDAQPAYTPEEIERYVEAWSQPGSATGMSNYYRASVRTSPQRAEAALRPINAPTLVIWGERDRHLGPELAEPDHDDVPNLDRVERLPDASHWVHHDEHEHVTQLLTTFSPPPCQPRTVEGRSAALLLPAIDPDGNEHGGHCRALGRRGRIGRAASLQARSKSRCWSSISGHAPESESIHVRPEQPH